MPRRPRPADINYDFRRMVSADLPLVRKWLHEPHVRQWSGDPEEQLALIAGDLAVPSMGCHIVSFNRRPFAYVQWWHTHTWQEYLDQPLGSRGIDPFIGEPDMIGAGHGSRLVAAFVELLFAAGAARVIIDPDPDHMSAIRAYEKAGFRRLGVRDTRDGPVLLMAIDKDD